MFQGQDHRIQNRSSLIRGTVCCPQTLWYCAFLNFKSRPEINFRPEINNGGPRMKTKKQNLATSILSFYEVAWSFYLFKVFQQQRHGLCCWNTDKDGIYDFWIYCEMGNLWVVTNLSLHLRFFLCVASTERNFSKLKLLTSILQPTIRKDRQICPSTEHEYAKEIRFMKTDTFIQDQK